MMTLGAEFAVLMLVSGHWHTPAKLEKTLDNLATSRDLVINLKRTGARPEHKDCVPYAVDVICLDQPGIVFHLSEFFAARNIEICDVGTRRYAAPHTGAPMFAAQMTVSIPASAPITVNAVSGYTGGGKGLIEEFQAMPPETTQTPCPLRGYHQLRVLRPFASVTEPPRRTSRAT